VAPIGLFPVAKSGKGIGLPATDKYIGNMEYQLMAAIGDDPIGQIHADIFMKMDFRPDVVGGHLENASVSVRGQYTKEIVKAVHSDENNRFFGEIQQEDDTMRMAIYMTDEDRRRCLTEQIGQSLVLSKQPFWISGFGRLSDLVYELEDEAGYDIVVFEIAQPQTAPQQIAQLRRAGFEGRLILASTSPAYAVDGYEWGADHYWVLPMDGQELEKRLNAVVRSLNKGCLAVRWRRRIVHLPFDSIVCAESRNSKCIIHRIRGEDVVVYCRLDDLADKLTDERFLRCHQSFLVNMDHVIGVDKEFMLTGSVIASIRQRDLKSIREQYAAYYQRRQGSVKRDYEVSHKVVATI